MKTVEQILRESGLTDEQIKALDQKVVAGVTQVLSTATQTLEQAELAKRAAAETFETEISPALDKWANDSANLEAQLAFYKTQVQKAKEGGFLPVDAPITPPVTTVTAQPARDNGGRFVPGRNEVPGSPQYMTREEGFAFASNSQWFIAEYARLHNGAFPPDDFATVAAEAGAQRLPFKTYVEKKYDLQAKRDKIKADEQKKHDDAIRAETTAEVTKKFAEQGGTNPNLRQAEVSRYSEIRKGVETGTRPDPLKMNREQRHVATRQAIQKDIAAAETVQ